MGRHRETVDPHEPLPVGLYKHRTQFRARHPAGGYQYFGTEWADACKAYKAWKQDGTDRGTLAWLLDLCISTVWPGRVKAGTLRERTKHDYVADAEILKAYVGHIPIKALTPKHVGDFRDGRGQIAPAHVRNEMSCLSAAMSYAVRQGLATANPCLQISKPRRKRRERLISHEEYLVVYARASAPVRRAMALALRTLALPDDVLAMGPRNIVRAGDGRRLLRFERGKVKGAWVEVELIGELAGIVDEALAERVVCETFVHKRNGKRFTRDGIGAMFRRHCVGSPTHKVDPVIQDFGIRDLRAKGATDMVRSGVDIHVVQRLLGHSSVRTTEIYIKELLPLPVRPNEVVVISGATR